MIRPALILAGVLLAATAQAQPRSTAADLPECRRGILIAQQIHAAPAEPDWVYPDARTPVRLRCFEATMHKLDVADSLARPAQRRPSAHVIPRTHDGYSQAQYDADVAEYHRALQSPQDELDRLQRKAELEVLLSRLPSYPPPY